MARFERDNGKAMVVQDNALIAASYTLTLNEKRMIMLAASKIDSRRSPKKETPLEFDITTAEWVAVFPDENPYTTMKRAADNMLGRYVTMHPKTGNTKKIAWFDSVEYFDGEGRVHVKFGWTMSFFLAGLFEEFTKINLLDISQLSSLYSIRLFELLNQFKSTGYRRISVEDFRIAMDCIKTYPAMADLRKRVLNPAIKEINEKTGLRIECRDIRKGRAVGAFEFIIMADKQGDLFKGGI